MGQPKATPFLDESSEIDCQIQFINVINKDGELKRKLGKEILQKI